MNEASVLGGLVLALLLSIIASSPVAAMRLTMDEAVARALQAYPDVAVAQKAVEIAEVALQQSKAWFPGNPYVSGGAGTTTQQGVGSNYGMYVSQELEIAGQRSKRMSVASEDVAKATWELKGAQQNLIAAVKTAFIHVLISIDRTTVARQTLDAMTDFRKRLSQSTRLNDVQRIELNNAHIQESRARREVAATQQTRDNALTTLRRLLGLPLDQEVDLSGIPTLQPRTLPSETDLVARALQQRPDLAAQRHALDRADAQIALVQREAVPNITVSGNVSRFEGETLTGGDVGFQIPVFQRKTAEISEAVTDRARERLATEGLQKTIEQETIEARRACDVAAVDLQALKDVVVPKYEETLEIQRRGFDRGDVTSSDTLIAQLDVFGARRELVDAIEAYNAALIELERVVGGSFDP